MKKEDEVICKLIRLSTGEDIIGYCLIDDDAEFVLVEDPMTVLVNRQSQTQQTMLMMMPWLPLELIEDNVATINYSDIITMVNPKESFIEYYTSIVDKYNAIIDKQEMTGYGDDEEDEDAYFDETMDQMLEELNQDKKNQTLH